MEIVLLRHGMPKIQKAARPSAAELAAWVSEYNAAGIDLDYPPPDHVIEQARECAFVICSDLPRSKESAHALGVGGVSACDSLFREVRMPYATWRSPRLPLEIWAVLFQLMWVLGYSANGESFSAGRKRARHCAERLAELAAEHGTVLFVGHGSLNWFIARWLKARGWSGPKKSPRRYWELGIYRYEGA